ncbi:histidinol-phosphatase (PHP family) [Thalassobacillus cyri]|uniref:Histidinol-phosphatase n=1 Tax=Thalassobacillus cyri TaxID=571932 RepID=A0A1H3XBC1_9BACI|nr:histidinol-phosphatase HisJ family protein [Thalassobacillus cyri]SDZ96540.1 histidinol-phosphatase (PHP family) [Thalassobacillus cyri]
MRTDYHVHMHETGDFSTEYLKEYLAKAQKEGIEELGISEHAYFFNETKNIISNPWIDNRRGLDFKEYQALFDKAKDEGLSVKMGIEMDYTPGKEAEMKAFIDAHPFDYVIGSVHWIGDWGIDLATFREEYERRDIKEAYRQYFDQVVTLAESKLFDFVGHIDLIKIFSYWPDDKDFLHAQYDRAVKALAESGTCIEISTAGLRKPVGEIYPDPVLLKKCYEAGVGIVLCSDAHKPDHIGYKYDESIELARWAGYDEIHVFSQRSSKTVPLD